MGSESPQVRVPQSKLGGRGKTRHWRENEHGKSYRYRPIFVMGGRCVTDNSPIYEEPFLCSAVTEHCTEIIGKHVIEHKNDRP